VKFKEKVIKTEQHKQLVGLLYWLSEPVVSVPVLGTQTGTYPQIWSCLTTQPFFSGWLYIR
jgi:hypothetical protein